MKKIVFILLLCFSTCFSNNKVEPKSRIIRVVKGMNNVLNDILTTKGAIKALVLASPLIIFYCKYYNYSPARITIEKGVNLVGYAKECYKIQEAYGRSSANLEAIGTNPKKYLFITFNGFIDKIINYGIPFLATLLASRIISSKK